MKKKIISIFICTLLFVSVVPAINILNNYKQEEITDLKMTLYNNEMPCEDCEENT